MSDDFPTLSEVAEQNIRGYLRRNRIDDEPGFNPMPTKFLKPRVMSNLLRKCCDTCHYFWVDAPTRYSQCRQFDIQLDGEDIAFIVRIGCASHSSFAQSTPSSKELIFLATTDFKNREERKGLHDQASWTSGWITGFLSERKSDWTKEREKTIRNELIAEMLAAIPNEGMAAWEERGYLKFINSFREGDH